ncbi:hypothetical protein CGCSCA1_v002443 [Colletotrichum siamense]|nr:hypothetical protein CGCSCA1_v002443 [Colletotrichum siamense]
MPPLKLLLAMGLASGQLEVYAFGCLLVMSWYSLQEQATHLWIMMGTSVTSRFLFREPHTGEAR